MNTISQNSALSIPSITAPTLLEYAALAYKNEEICAYMNILAYNEEDAWQQVDRMLEDIESKAERVELFVPED